MEQTVLIQNKSGLHARPASLFVQAAGKFKSQVRLTARGKTIDAKSILLIMSLGLGKGTEITISAEGEDEVLAVETLAGLVESKFGEAD
ncbi:MAG TPA: HPr family phosphocarrier protein [Selenomonadales bacterium]|nr:HPr family phosphocarrier protein [Selenomonadales bacterium]